MILALETAGIVAAAVILIGLWALFCIYVTDSDPGKQPRAGFLHRALLHGLLRHPFYVLTGLGREPALGQECDEED